MADKAKKQKHRRIEAAEHQLDVAKEPPWMAKMKPWIMERSVQGNKVTFAVRRRHPTYLETVCWLPDKDMANFITACLNFYEMAGELPLQVVDSMISMGWTPPVEREVEV